MFGLQPIEIGIAIGIIVLLLAASLIDPKQPKR